MNDETPSPTAAEILAPPVARAKRGRRMRRVGDHLAAPREAGALLVPQDRYRARPQTVFLPTPERVNAWEHRMRLIERHYVEPQPGDAKLALQVLEEIACGSRIGTALVRVDRDWPWLNRSVVANKELKAVYECCVELSRAVRKHKLEDEAIRRAEEGWEEPVFTQSGKLAGYKRRYSDALMVLLLRAHDPDRYSDKAIGVGGGVVLQVNLGISRDPVPEALPYIDVQAVEIPRQALVALADPEKDDDA